MEVFLNNGTVTPAFKQEFMTQTKFNESMVEKYVYGKNSALSKYILGTTMPAVHTYYTGKKIICDSKTAGLCSNRQLAWAQWTNGALLGNPMPSMPQNTMANPTFKDMTEFSTLDMAPELKYYTDRAGLAEIKVDLSDAFNWLNRPQLASNGLNDPQDPRRKTT